MTLILCSSTHAEVSRPVIVPPAGGVNQSCWVKLPDKIGEAKFRIPIDQLAPAFVINNLRIAQ